MSKLDVPELEALELLLRNWEVHRADCSPMERLGLTRLKKQGKLRIKRGVYYAPKFTSWDEFEAWFDWFYSALGITREVPVTVNTGQVNT